MRHEGRRPRGRRSLRRVRRVRRRICRRNFRLDVAAEELRQLGAAEQPIGATGLQKERGPAPAAGGEGMAKYG